MFLRLEDEVGERNTTWSNLVRRPGQAEEAEQRAEGSEQGILLIIRWLQLVYVKGWHSM